MNFKDIKISDYSYILPDEKIAKFPIEKRENSNLLFYNGGSINIQKFLEIPDILPKDNLLVSNNTKVIYARINFYKKTGSKIEIFCLKPYQPADYETVFSERKSCKWECIVGNLKKWKEEDLSKTIFINNEEVIVYASKNQKIENKVIVEFKWNGGYTFSEILNNIGQIPIPPYLNRQSQEIDKSRYQTVYSRIGGSVAAPTAGLHFTESIFEKLKNQNIKHAEITLHVGAGTFIPVKTDVIGGHQMHTEFFTVTRKSFNLILNNLGRITAVGTTSMRTLESLYVMGAKKLLEKTDYDFVKQWEVYDLPEFTAKEALEALNGEFNENDELTANTQIIIVPGYKFKIVNSLITNFHQPNSTLLLLVAAFVGDDWKKIYDYALNNKFRFLSYGDSSFLIPKH